MTPAEFSQLNQRLDGLQALLLAHHQWTLLELARQRALLESVPLRSLSVRQQREIWKLLPYRVDLHTQEFLKSFQAQLDSARDQMRLADSEN